MKTTYQKDDRLPQHTAVGNDDTPITYPTSPHEWMSVKAVEEKDGRIAELEAVNERLEAENHHLQTAAADVMAENVRLEGEVERLSSGAKKLLSKCDQLLNELRESDAIVVSQAEKLGRFNRENARLTAALGKCSQARAELAAAIKPVADMYNENFGVSRITIEWQQNGEWHESYYDPLPLSRLARALKGIKE